MKKILLPLIVLSFSAYAQEPINNYFAGVPGNPEASATYTILAETNPIDQSATGANATWDFDGLVEVGTATYSTVAPTAEEAAEFPGTNIKVHQTATDGTNTTESDVYFANSGSTVSISGIASDGLQLNYNEDLATIGDFPLLFGETETNDVAGTYVFDTYSGDFSGTITTTYDAYGTLDNNLIGDAETVYRIRTEQNLTMSYLLFPDAGSVTQVLYHYYRTGEANPFFKTTTTSIDVPLLSINETQTVVEQLNIAMGVNETALAQLELYPNPVSDILSVHNPSQQQISISVSDASGRIVARSEFGNVDVSALPEGVYLAKIKSHSGETVRKFIKR